MHSDQCIYSEEWNTKFKECRVKDQASHPYKALGKIITLLILI